VNSFVTYVPYIVFASWTTFLAVSAYTSDAKSLQYPLKQKRKAEDALLRLRSKQLENLEAERENPGRDLQEHDLHELLQAVSNDAEVAVQQVRDALEAARIQAQTQVLAKQGEGIVSS